MGAVDGTWTVLAVRAAGGCWRAYGSDGTRATDANRVLLAGAAEAAASRPWASSTAEASSWASKVSRWPSWGAWTSAEEGPPLPLALPATEGRRVWFEPLEEAEEAPLHAWEPEAGPSACGQTHSRYARLVWGFRRRRWLIGAQRRCAWASSTAPPPVARATLGSMGRPVGSTQGPALATRCPTPPPSRNALWDLGPSPCVRRRSVSDRYRIEPD